MKKIACTVLCFALVVLSLSSCIVKKDTQDTQTAINLNESYMKSYEKSDAQTNYVQIEIEGGAIIIVELYPDVAPITVENFKKLVSQGFYNGLIFHRVIEGFMIQGGSSDNTNNIAETITGEFQANNITNNLSHERGVISMARRANPYYNSASSQFFIVHEDSKFLDGDYAAFGRVIEGMETVDQIAVVKTDSSDKPLSDVKIKSVYFIEKP